MRKPNRSLLLLLSSSVIYPFLAMAPRVLSLTVPTLVMPTAVALATTYNEETTVTPCGECFSDQDLSAALKEKRDALMLSALDGAGLFTFVGELKPLSAAEITQAFNEKYQLESLSLKDLRKINRSLQCGKVAARYYYLTNDLHDDKGSYMGYQNTWSIQVYRSDLFRKKVIDKKANFDKLGINVDRWLSADANPTEIIDQLSTLMGKRKNLAARDLYNYLQGETINREDPQQPEAATVVQEYKQRREAVITQDSVHGAVQLMRDWYQGEGNQCSFENASKK